MFDGGLIGAATPTVVTTATVVIFIVAVLAVVVLSLLIARRTRLSKQPVVQRRSTTTRPEPAPRSPADIQGRLRRLAGELDSGPESTTQGAAAGAAAMGVVHQDEPAPSRASQPAAPTPAVFERDELQPKDRRQEDSTRYFEDSTRYFDDAPPHVSPEEDPPLDQTKNDREWDSATRFFDDDDAPLLRGDRQTPASDDREVAAHFGFGSDAASMTPWSTAAGDDPDVHEGTTGANAPSPLTGAAPAELRELMATASLPFVLALTVIDGAGRFLAGESDPDLVGEIRALVDESGFGMSADLEQTVLLADDSSGAIVVLPTGVQAILGALTSKVHDEAAEEKMRRELRGLAKEIGDILHYAS